MTQHALHTALTLYMGGTLDAETAAARAGVSPARLRRAVQRAGGTLASSTPTREHHQVRAD